MAGVLEGAKLFELSPEHVDEGQRIGFLHEDKAAALGRLMAVDGQRDPIKVVANPKNPDRPWRLVTGMHRLIGARIEGITVIAIEVSGKPEALADLEASENLHRRPLGPIERAKFTAALVRAAQERIAREHGNLKHYQLGAKARWAKVKTGEMRSEEALRSDVDDASAKIAEAYGWEESAADALGMSKRTIHYDLTLSRLLIEPFPDLIEALAKHPIVGENASQLKALCAIKDVPTRRQVIEALLADDELSADEARVHAGVDLPAGPEPLAHQKQVNAVVGNLGRMTATLQKRYVPDFVRALKSDEVKRLVRAQIEADLGEASVDDVTERPSAATAHAMGRAIRLLTDLLDGERGISDDEMADTRAVLQQAVGCNYEPGSLAFRMETEGRI